MNFSAKILSEISEINNEIETTYPELYAFLDENPITIPNELHPEMDDSSLGQYLETLKSVLSKYKEEGLLKNP
jgi:hypothetical protein